MSLNYQHKYLSVDEYLEGERVSTVKHELINGEAYAMAGASTNHNRIVANITRLVGNVLFGSTCEPFASDMKVQVEDNFYYPDALIVCDHKGNDDGISHSPLVIFEVLSKSTRQTDHTIKRNSYQNIPELEAYIIIEQDLVDIEVCRREKHWQSEHYYLGDEIELIFIDLSLSVLEIYDRVASEDMTSYLEKLNENINA